MIIECILAFFATFWFAIIFNVKGKKIIFASAGGALAWFVYKYSMQLDYALPIAFFIASISLTIYSEVLARVLKTPVTTILIPGLIPLVPGRGIYQTMLYTVQSDTAKALLEGLDTLFAAGALAFGIVFVSSTARILKEINKKNG